MITAVKVRDDCAPICTYKLEQLTTPENTITYHNALCLSPQNFAQEKLKSILMQNFGVTNKEHYGMLWHFLE